MRPQNYLEEELQNCSHHEPTQQDKQLFEKLGIEAFLYQKITAKKYRKWKLDSSSEESIKKAIHINAKENKPLQFTFPFGGYKLWRLATEPEVDWAEFFTIVYYCKWIAPILQFYKPGAIFSFSSDDVIVERMDNIPKKDTDAYFNSFNQLLNYFKKHFVENMHMQIKRVGDFYESDEFEVELEKNIDAAKMEHAKLTAEQNERWLKISRLNVCFDGARDLTKLSKKEKEEVIKMGPIYHHAYTKLSKRRAFVRGKDKIVVFTTPIPNAIALGTTKTSVTKFWTGTGVLEKREESFQDRILSPEQIESVQKADHKVEEIDLISLANFATIKVYTEPFNFVPRLKI